MNEGDALNLDVEYHRLDDRLLELVKAESAEELRAVLRERDQICAERRGVSTLSGRTARADSPCQTSVT
jgi:hypothetical protein